MKFLPPAVRLLMVFLILPGWLLAQSTLVMLDEQEGGKRSRKRNEPLLTGAEQFDKYLPLLENKQVGLVVNHTSMVDEVHLLDTLIAQGVAVKKIFAPEHGFRGIADAGAHINNSMDMQTGLPIISLYGKNKKPTPEQLKGLDIVIFDIQDVGARFYTYISTMHYMMETCADEQITFMVLDRPNPNGFYVDGPVLEPDQQSFVGMHPVPIVHGMTVGEYAQMINGEYWLKDSLQVKLTIIPCRGYDHKYFYELPINPSPNLTDMRAIYLYPSLCLFEGTVASVGRGTPKPFQVYGHPDYTKGDYTFTPQSRLGASQPKYNQKDCKGYDLSTVSIEQLRSKPSLSIDYVLNFYWDFDHKDKFFNSYFNRLAGNAQLKDQIISDTPSADIRKSWQKDLDAFKEIRKKYLIYQDFE